MAISGRIELRQTQSLVITPQLVQAIRLLQMSGAELERFVAAELEQNPLLRRDEAGEEGAGEAMPAAADVTSASAKAAGTTHEPAFRLSGSAAGRGNGSAAGSDAPDRLLDAVAAESLAERLEQAIDHAFGAAERSIALALLSNLDEAGYLTASIAEATERLGADAATVEAVLRRCQKLAPPGMFARSLAECLALQLAAEGRLDPAMRAMLANLPLVAADDRAGLSLACGVDREDIDAMIAELRALDPKPGLAFSHEPVATLVPDVIVRADGRDFTVELNAAALPRLIVDRRYHARLAAGARSETDTRYLADCLQKASWLERSLDQRASTVLKVAAEIVRRQAAFFAEGVGGLRPLNLKAVADAIGVHESTVSRAAANKTMTTPRGIFQFRYFFTVAIPATDGGDSHSSEAVKHRIRQLISSESPHRALSDDAIAAILSQNGVDIARRTVAKYRELMGIESSVARRREKRVRAAI